MNIFRTTLVPVAFAAAAIMPAAAFAQVQSTPQNVAAPTRPAQGSRHHRSRFALALRSLNLSDAQKAQIKHLRQEFRQAHSVGSPRDPQARKALRGQILGILTPQQRAQLEANLRQLRQRSQTHPR